MNTNIAELFVLTFINTFGIFLIIVILANSYKDRLYQWFVIMTVFLLGWVNFAYLGYVEENLAVAGIAYRLNMSFVFIFLFTAYVFLIENFLKINHSKLKWGLFSATIIFVFLSLFTNTLDREVVAKEWGNDTVPGILYPLLSLYILIVICIITYYLISNYFKQSIEGKRKILYFLIGTFMLIVFNVIFNILSPLLLQTARYQHFGDYSAIIFLAFTAFAMLRHKFLDIKVALAAFLISALGMLLIIDILLLSDTLSEQGLKIILFMFFIVISVILMRSVLNEIKQREELAEVNKALEKSKQRYIDLAQEQKDIIDVMGHEIRTPLTAIIQELNLSKKVIFPDQEKWKEGKLPPEKQKEYIGLMLEGYDTIDKASVQAASIVKNMLETARLDKKRFELSYEKFDLIEAVDSSIEVMERTSDQNIDIKFQKPASLKLEVEADKTRIKEAVEGLLRNSIKYRDPQKSLINISVNIVLEGEDVVVSIKDNGIGMDPGDIPKLGKKFVRLNSQMNGGIKRPGGTGLGLFVVKGVMEYHKGKLIIESEGLGKGSTFSLKFPRYREPEPSAS